MKKQYTKTKLEKLSKNDLCILVYDYYPSIYDKLSKNTSKKTIIEWFLKKQGNRIDKPDSDKKNCAKLNLSVQSDKASMPQIPENQFDKLRDWLDYLVDAEFRDMMHSLLNIKEQNRLPKPLDFIDRGAFLGQMKIYRRLNSVEQYLYRHYSERFVEE
ncbi:hypothetical protein QUF63_16400 [Anaerolineales bacterium HSG25]|nr:hypothetical protein [Anaerolineales bacterium HSG25]